ncbi:MAG: nucleotide-diphospho-sugar transferase [Spirochaetaceae bacterium]|nr:nucleotide-diphospho-sugar transferase [Spirochaetaceae bacterium]
MEFRKNKLYFNTPILFLIFNRLDTTKQVFEKIRSVTPSKLYIASDGPRDNRIGEDEKVKTIREYVFNSIDWNCEVKTLFREKNLGCGKAVSQAITWFFENEEMGIILEDDCLPSSSFFPYCEELLNKYKDDARIFHIAGHNPLTYTKMKYSYYFARIQHCWGWASWRRAWEKYSFDINDLNSFMRQKKINKIFATKADRIYWTNIFIGMAEHKVDTWDYQWTYTIFNNNGICINPSKNLVTNIGFGPDATHTTNDDPSRNNQERYEISKIIHPKEIKINKQLINLINRIVFGISNSTYAGFKTILKNIIKRFFSLFISKYKKQV